MKKKTQALNSVVLVKQKSCHFAIGIQNDWKKAIELLSTLAIGGYLCGCVLGAVVNLGLYLWQKNI